MARAASRGYYLLDGCLITVTAPVCRSCTVISAHGIEID
jgi:hypothetical protein